MNCPYCTARAAGEFSEWPATQCHECIKGALRDSLRKGDEDHIARLTSWLHDRHPEVDAGQRMTRWLAAERERIAREVAA